MASLNNSLKLFANESLDNTLEKQIPYSLETLVSRAIKGN